MKYKNILLTGSSGKLGQAITTSKFFSSLLTPSEKILDITKTYTIKTFFSDNDIDALIHCAALARMAECENNPVKAIHTNIIGTSNLVAEVLKKDNLSQKKIRFVYISSDGVYPGTRGNYTERDEVIPYNKYGWSKLGAECAVNLLVNFCIIRTSFFDPQDIRFDASATDVYSSRVTLPYLVKAIAIMLESDFIGTINIGSERKSDYKRYKEFKPELNPCKQQDILRNVSFRMNKDASLNFNLWKKLEMKKKRNG